MRARTTRYWLLLCAAYAGVSLFAASRLLPPPPGAAHPEGGLVAATGPWLDGAASRRETQPGGIQLHEFRIPFERGTLADAWGAEFSLEVAGTSDWTLQVQAVGDNHLTYIHNHRNLSGSTEGRVFRVPLREKAKGYWIAAGHDAEWSAWNTVALRSLSVRVFMRCPSGEPRVRVQYRFLPLADSPVLSVAWLQPLANRVPLGRRFEVAFDISGWRGNPFDFEALDICLETVAPDGAVTRTQAFLYQAFEDRLVDGREELCPKGPKHLRARVRPRVAGQHAYRLLVRGIGEPVELAAGAFTVDPGEVPPFIRVSRESPFFFETADGHFFYPIGWALLCPIDQPHQETYVPYLPDQNSLAMMKRMIDDLADAGGNCLRFWLTDWWSGMEWNEKYDNYGGLGRYNLKNAWLVDQVLDHCERRGVHVIFETVNHLRTRPTDRRYGGAWVDHPANPRGDPSFRSAMNYWSDVLVVPHEKRRLSYIVARYADSPAIHSWNYASETDLASLCDFASVHRWRAVEQRVDGLLSFMRRRDPYHHPTTTHVANMEWALSFVRRQTSDFMHSNAYASRAARGILSEEQIEAVRVFSENCRSVQKPALITEFGGRWLVEPAERRRRDLSAGLWAGVCSRLSGAPMAWWWNFIYGEDLGSAWTVVAQFMEGEDLRREDTPEKGAWQNRENWCLGDGGSLQALMVGNRSRRFLYVFNFDTVGRTRMIPTVCRKAKVSFKEMAPGRYRAEFWSPREGRTGIESEIEVGPLGRAVLPLPDVAQDWVVKIVPAAEDSAFVGTEPVVAAAAARGDAAGVRATSKWHWVVDPLLPVCAERAAERCVYEATIALPEGLAGWFPDIHDGTGTAIPFSATFPGGGRAWRLRIPANAKPPFRVWPSEKPVRETTDAVDENGIGLLMSVLPLADHGVFESEEASTGLFEKYGAQAQRLRVRKILQVENPVGKSDNYIARYEGPILIPKTGTYTFSVNSDDGSFARINGTTVVQWLGQHDMEVQNGPMVDHWRVRGNVQLERGVHWLEYYHYDVTGAQLAKLGWLSPNLSNDLLERTVFCSPLDKGLPGWEVVPEQMLDGRIPCTVQVHRDGTKMATSLACRGLRLRRPGRDIHTVLVAGPGGQWRLHSRATPGLAAGVPVPVWIESTHWRSFSVEWLQARNRAGHPLLRVFAHDAELPIELMVSGESRGLRPHARRAWADWELAEQDSGAPFTLRLQGIPLIDGRLSEWVSLPAPAAINRASAARVVSLWEPARPFVLPAEACRSWYRGPAAAATEPMGLDPWDIPEAALQAVLEQQVFDDTAVLIPLENGAFSRGLSGPQVYRRLALVLNGIARSGGLPVLVLPADLDVKSPLKRQYALMFVRLSNEFDCPLVDLRKMARDG